MEVVRPTSLILALVILHTSAASSSGHVPLISTRASTLDTNILPCQAPIVTKSSNVWQHLFDPSFQEETYGSYWGGLGSLSGASVGGIDVGKFQMPTPWSTVRYGLIGMVGDGQGMGGGEVGFRLHPSTRLAPYVGLSGVVEVNGFSKQSRYNRYYYDSNGHRRTSPNWGYYPTGVAAIVPEAGLSYWITSSARLNVGISYYVTTGKLPDFVATSVSMDFALSPVGPAPAPVYPSRAGTDDSESDSYFVSEAPISQEDPKQDRNVTRAPAINPPAVPAESVDDLLPRLLFSADEFLPQPPLPTPDT